MSDFYRDICKPVLKLDFKAHGIMSPSQNLDSGKASFVLCNSGIVGGYGWM